VRTWTALYILVRSSLVTHVRFRGKALIYRTNDYYQTKGGVSTKFRSSAKPQRLRRQVR
jgi:hypothetical protein